MGDPVYGELSVKAAAGYRIILCVWRIHQVRYNQFRNRIGTTSVVTRLIRTMAT